jgi:alpha-L-fucosidase 2
MKQPTTLITAILLLFACNLLAQPGNFTISKYDVVWNSPSEDAKGSMPLGNGDIGLNVWVEPNGDLLFLIGKTDAFDEFNRLLKLGRIRIKTTPALFQPGEKFEQALRLADGTIEIKTATAHLRLWVDANHPVVQVDMQSTRPVNAQVIMELWRNEARALGETGTDQMRPENFSVWGNWPGKARVNPDTILPAKKNQLSWCHFNTESQWKRNLELTALGEEVAKNQDPVLHRTFGAIVRAKDFTAISDKILSTKQAVKAFSVQIIPLTQIANTPVEWLKAVEAIADNIKLPVQQRFVAHKNWWNKFWDRSWIEISSAVPDSNTFRVSQAYNLQRYVNACSGRGGLPIKFNGSLFTVEGPDPDFRAWGGGYWFQNTRLPYWSMLYSGDYEMMLPLFGMYMKALPLRKAATRKYYHHEGAFYPETIYFWGNYMDAENYGLDRKGKPDGLADNTYIRRYWTSGMELVVMMLDYYDATKDAAFLQKTLLPFATEIMKFFDQHWNRGSDGKIVFDPSQSLETWQVATNPTPEIVGIRYISERLLPLTKDATLQQQWQKTLNDLPAVPMQTEQGLTRLLPAEKYSSKSNTENPELYAVFPYRVYTGMADSEKHTIGLNTWAKRQYQEDYGWQQNCIQSALLGLKEEAKNMVVSRAVKTASGYRFPAFYGPNYDWTPDQTHGTVMMTGLQRMLMQCEGDKINLLPAWPAEWNVRFKLCGPNRTTVECVYENGNVQQLKVTPVDRKKDIVGIRK